MRAGGERLNEVLGGYNRFLIQKALSSRKELPYLVRQVRDFLLFARTHGGFTFEQTLDLFLAQVGERIGTQPWQVQQAANAIRIYRYQYRAAGNEGDWPRHAQEQQSRDASCGTGNEGPASVGSKSRRGTPKSAQGGANARNERGATLGHAPPLT